MSMDAIVEGFAVETIDDLVFTVKGLIHPPDRVIAYVRYLHDASGNRVRGGMTYRRVYHFEEQEGIVGARYPMYHANDPVLGMNVQGVPRLRIRTVYDPRAYLVALRGRGPQDLLEEQALKLSRLLEGTTAIPRASLGVSGSLMLGLHQPASDLDLIVYGEAAGREGHKRLRDMLGQGHGQIRRLREAELAALHSEHCADTPLTFDEFARLQRRKVNELRFGGRETFIRFVKLPEEVDQRYGDHRFRLLRQATIRARVTDDRDAIFTPCRYGVSDARFLGGSLLPELQEIVSFRGRFSDQVQVGEWAIARGRLEQVIGSKTPPYQRLVVGGRAGEYLLARDLLGDENP